jgi:hypothetical protein
MALNNYFSPTVIGSYHDIAETMTLNNYFSPTVIGLYHDIAEPMALNNSHPLLLVHNMI